METDKLDSTLQILSYGEMQEINGGESLWYWVGYGVGATGRFFSSMWKFAEEHPFELFNA